MISTWPFAITYDSGTQMVSTFRVTATLLRFASTRTKLRNSKILNRKQKIKKKTDFWSTYRAICTLTFGLTRKARTY